MGERRGLLQERFLILVLGILIVVSVLRWLLRLLGG